MEERHGWELATYPQRVIAFLLDMALLIPLTLVIGYIIWWLIVLGRAQTPGKQIVGIQVVKDTGEPVGWGYMFLREFVIKGLLGGFLSQHCGRHILRCGSHLAALRRQQADASTTRWSAP